MVMNLTDRVNQFLSACKKNIVSASFSPETKAPARGLFRNESVAKSKAPFNGSCGDRFF